MKEFREYAHLLTNLKEVDIAFANEIYDLYKKYYKDVPSHHGFDHVLEVTNTAIGMFYKLNTEVTYRTDIRAELILAGIGHDVMSFKNRKLHHVMGKQFLIKNKQISNVAFIKCARLYGRSINIYNAACAICEHRASYAGEYTSIVSEIISAADRGEPNIIDIVSRINECSLDPKAFINLTIKSDIFINSLNISLDEYISSLDILLEHEKRTLHHLYDKYSKNGYARYNDVYKKYYGKQLNEMYDKIEYVLLNPIALKEILEYVNVK